MCKKCGGQTTWMIELTTAGSPYGTGYEMEVCEDCNEPTGEKRWVGF